MIIDTLVTATSYNKDTVIVIDEDGNVTIDNTPNYVVFKCYNCGNQEKKSFEEIIKDFKTTFVNALIRTRQLDSYENLDRSLLKEESGMSYCGMCPGPFEADGYCLNDLKEQCIVRKFCLDKKNGKI